MVRVCPVAPFSLAPLVSLLPELLQRRQTRPVKVAQPQTTPEYRLRSRPLKDSSSERRQTSLKREHQVLKLLHAGSSSSQAGWYGEWVLPLSQILSQEKSSSDTVRGVLIRRSRRSS